MPITINLTRGRTATFPDGTSDEVIKRILDEDYPLEGVDIDEMVQSDPDFMPTFDQYKLFQQYAYDKDESMLSNVGEGLGHVADVGWAAAKEMPGMAWDEVKYQAKRKLIPGAKYFMPPVSEKTKRTVGESFMQGTRELLGMGAQSADPDSIFFRWKSFMESRGAPTDRGRYEQFKDAREFQRRTLQMEDGRTMSLADVAQLIQKNPEYPETVLRGLHFDFDDPHTQKRLKELGWEKGMQPKELVNTTFVKGAKFISDFFMLIPGFGVAGKGATIGTKAASVGMRASGKMGKVVGGGVYRGGTAVAEGAMKVATEATGVSPGMIRGGAAAVGVATDPGQVVTTAMLAARGIEAIGNVLHRAGEVMATGPTRKGAFRAAADSFEKGTLEYRLARNIGRLDTPIALAGQAAEAGLYGGLIGGGLGFLYAGSEGFGPGFGAGFGMGATAGGVVGVGQRAFGKNSMTQKRANDVLNQVARMDPAQAAMFQRLVQEQGVDVAANVLDWAAFMEGRLGDGAVRYYYDPNAPRGQVDKPSMTEGRPTLDINLAKLDADYTVGHEIVHGLDHIEELQPIMHQIRQEIAGMWVDGKLVEQGGMTQMAIAERYVEYMDLLASGRAKNRVSRIIDKAEKRGVKLSKEDVKRIHAEEHRNALEEATRGHKTDEQRAMYVADEKMAEDMARLIKGAGPDAGLHMFDSVTQRILDHSLLKYKSTVLGGTLGRLADWGIDPYDSMLFKNMEQAPPELNAMLRNLIRARKNLAKEITVQDKRPDIIAKKDVKHRVKELKRLGLVKQNDKGEWTLKDDKEIEAEEVANEAALMSILSKDDPNGFNAERVVDESTGKASINLTGRRFSPEQVEAIQNSPSILPTTKAAVVEFNKAAAEGRIQNITYYAATRRVKNRATGRYRSRYGAGIKKSNRNVLPYSLEISAAGSFYVKTIDWTLLTNDVIALASRKKLSQWENKPSVFLEDFSAYLENLASGTGRRSAELFGQAKADFMHDLMQKQYRGGSKYIKNFRLDRMDGITPTGERATMSEQAWQMSKARFMPDLKDLKVTRQLTGGDGWLFRDGKFLNLGDRYSHESGIEQWAKNVAGRAGVRTRDVNARKILKAAPEGGARSRAFDFAARVAREKHYGADKLWIEADDLTPAQRRAAKDWGIENGVEVIQASGMRHRPIYDPGARFMPETDATPVTKPTEAMRGKAAPGAVIPAVTVISPELAARFMPPAVNDPGFASVEGKMAFPMLADRLKVGEYISRSGKRHELRGGPDHPDLADNKGIVAWAVDGGSIASQLQKAINQTDGIGLVVLQDEAAVSGNRTFGEIMIDELRHDAATNKKAARSQNRRIRDAALWVRKWAKAKGKKKWTTFKPETLDDLAAAMPDMSFELRGEVIRKVASVDYQRKTGGIFWRDVMREVTAYQNKDGYRTGDIVKVIQFEKGESIVDPAEVGTPAHPSYRLAVKGRSISNVKGRLSAYQVFREAFNKMEKEKPGRGITPEGKIGKSAFRSMQMRSLTDPIFREDVGGQTLDVKAYDTPLEFAAKSGPERAEIARRSEVNREHGARFMPPVSLSVKNIAEISSQSAHPNIVAQVLTLIRKHNPDTKLKDHRTYRRPWGNSDYLDIGGLKSIRVSDHETGGGRYADHFMINIKGPDIQNQIDRAAKMAVYFASENGSAARRKLQHELVGKGWLGTRGVRSSEQEWQADHFQTIAANRNKIKQVLIENKAVPPESAQSMALKIEKGLRLGKKLPTDKNILWKLDVYEGK